MDDNLKYLLEHGAARRIVITVNGRELENINEGSVFYQHILCDDNDLTPGGCNPAQLTFVVDGTERLSGYDVKLKWIVDGYPTPVDIFSGSVARTELQPDKQSRKVICYDKLYFIRDSDWSDWYRNLFSPAEKDEYKGEWVSGTTYNYGDVVLDNNTYYRWLVKSDDMIVDADGNPAYVSDVLYGLSPYVISQGTYADYVQMLDVYDRYIYSTITIRTLRNAIADKLRLNMTGTRLNDDVAISYYPGTYTGGDIISASGLLTGTYPRITPTGRMDWLDLSQSQYVICQGNVEQFNSTYAEYITNAISRIVILSPEGKILVDRRRLVHDGEPTLVMQNFMLYNTPQVNCELIAERLAAELPFQSYRPADLSLIHSIPITAGMRLEYRSSAGEQVLTYALNVSFSGLQMINARITARGQEKRDKPIINLYDAVQAGSNNNATANQATGAIAQRATAENNTTAARSALVTAQITATAGYTVDYGSITKQGTYVCATGKITGSITAGTKTHIITLPDGFKPPYDICNTVVLYDSNNQPYIGVLTAETGGNVYITPPATVDTAYINIGYFLQLT